MILANQFVATPEGVRCFLQQAVALAAVVIVSAAAFSGQGSVYYEYKVVAMTTAGQFESFDRFPSINDQGQVAFVGRRTQASGRQSENIFVWNPSTAAVSQVMASIFELPRDGAAPLHQFPGSVQMNNSATIVARRRLDAIVQVGPPFGSILTAPLTYIERWNGNTTALPSQVAMGNGGVGAACSLLFWLNPVSAGSLPSPYGCGSSFSAIYPNPSINNIGGTVFSALQSTNKNVLSTSTAAGNFSIELNAELPRPMIADNNNIVMRLGSASPGGQIIVLPPAFVPFVDTITNGTSKPPFLNVGRAPGISDDGAVVAFIGETANNGRGPNTGLYIAFREPTGTFSDPEAVVGANFYGASPPRPELGVTIAGDPIYFAGFDIDSRVSVTHVSLGRPGYQDDSVVVAFLATPSSASRENPHVPGVPLLFSANRGLWTARVDIEPNLDPATPGFGVHANTIRPVYQIGDSIDAEIVTDLSVNDAIAAAPRTLPGGTQRIDDHRVVFHATLAGGKEAIIRSEYLDSDEDGLPDFWETPGKGIDIDRDGTVDLDLAAMYANPNQRDVFLEIDWTQPRTSGFPGGWTNEPAPDMNQYLAQMFAGAPETPTGVRSGIRLHIDAGPGVDQLNHRLSWDFPRNATQGGSLIGQIGSASTHLDMISFGKPVEAVQYGVLRRRSLDELKPIYFGSADKGARELAFRYAVFTDTHSVREIHEIDPKDPCVPKSPCNPENTFSAFQGDIDQVIPNGILTAVPVPRAAIDNWLYVHSGTASGEMRRIVDINGGLLYVEPAWDLNKTPDINSSWVILDSGTGLAETRFYNQPSRQGIPGNDVIVCTGSMEKQSINGALPFANVVQQWRVLAHEIGHTLGLRHGGTDHCTDDSTCGFAKCDYLSIMNYAYLLEPRGIPCCAVVCSTCPSIGFSSNHAVFNDWDNLKLACSATPLTLGNSLRTCLGNLVGSDAADPPVSLLLRSPPGTNPEVSMLQPLLDSFHPLGSEVSVQASADDEDGDLQSVRFSLDINGNRVVDNDELFVAALDVHGDYSATLPPISGHAGFRIISAIATDDRGHIAVDSRHVVVGCLGDLNGDSLVEDADFVIFVVAYNVLDCADVAMPSDCSADLNTDGVVDDSDFQLFVLAYNELLCP